VKLASSLHNRTWMFGFAADVPGFTLPELDSAHPPTQSPMTLQSVVFDGTVQDVVLLVACELRATAVSHATASSTESSVVLTSCALLYF